MSCYTVDSLYGSVRMPGNILTAWQRNVLFIIM